ICGKVYNHKNSFYRHKASHKGSQFVCGVCGMKFTRADSKKRHLDRKRCQYTNKIYTCSTCGKVYNHRSSYYRHKASHKGSQFECEVCGLKFTRADSKKRHLDRKRCQYTDKIYACSTCGKVYSHRSSYYRHKASHKKRQFECEVCGMKFTRADSKKRHLDRNRCQYTNKIYACGTCGKVYNHRSSYYRQNASHKGNQFECGVCGMKFTRADIKKRHLERKRSSCRYTNKIYACSTCSKVYSHRSSYYRHKALHKGSHIMPIQKKIYASSTCGKVYNHRSSYNRHNALNTGSRFECRVCGMKFTRANSKKWPGSKIKVRFLV
ncbi:hypothetical protein HELRODRAFT_68975, partial [Helobdella robusta]|uniref:C2H2-type domain-containing protein n=1 Tax=Helobdella robusta TaxID=6412 RepID=T1FZM8_HELRO